MKINKCKLWFYNYSVNIVMTVSPMENNDDAVLNADGEKSWCETLKMQWARCAAKDFEQLLLMMKWFMESLTIQRQH